MRTSKLVKSFRGRQVVPRCGIAIKGRFGRTRQSWRERMLCYLHARSEVSQPCRGRVAGQHFECFPGAHEKGGSC